MVHSLYGKEYCASIEKAEIGKSVCLAGKLAIICSYMKRPISETFV